MSFFKRIEIGWSKHGGETDAFARLRVSNPHTIFDSKQIFNNQPLIWDDQETSGSGTSSVHSSDRASSKLKVAGTTAGVRVRQTFERFNYQPGKSQLILMTFIMDSVTTGITKRVGQFDENNGIFIEDDEGTLNVVIRSHVTGAPVDEKVAQSSWNLDVMDGTGPSEVTLDLSKNQILIIDYEWLGTGRARIGFFIHGEPNYIHEFTHANTQTAVHMSTPNNPLRYEIVNDGTGAASELEHICGTVISEGGGQPIGIERWASTGGVHVDANSADTIYAVLGLKLKTAALGCRVDIEEIPIIPETNDDFEWMLKFNPTIADTFAFNDLDISSCVQVASGSTANTVTGGTDLFGGFGTGGASSGVVTTLENVAIKLGAAIDGTRDIIVLCVRPLSTNLDIQGGINFREIE